MKRTRFANLALSLLSILAASTAAWAAPEPLSVANAPDPFRVEVAELISRALPAEAPMSVAQIDAVLSAPPQFEQGQMAFPTFALAKALRSNPAQIAGQIAQAIQAAGLSEMVSGVRALGPYVNFDVNFDRYATWLHDRIESKIFFDNAPPAREGISLEYSQPNTHKALHVGHLRNMVLGESVARILEYAGHDVVRTTYPGDLGAHIAKVLWYISRVKGGELPREADPAWLGRMYAEADAHVKSREADSAAAAQDKAGISEVLSAIERRQGSDYELYLKTREWSLDEMRRIYGWLGIRFDRWFFESECDEPSRNLVERKYQEGLFVKSDGAIGARLEEFGLGFALLLKSDGNGLYLTKDLELIRAKFEDPAIKRSLVVVDARQKLHFQQVFKIAELMGYPQAESSVHLSYETVNDASGKAFSSRTMNGMGLNEIRQAVYERLLESLRRGSEASLPSERLERMAEQMALAAIKYGFLKVEAGRAINFNLNDWLRLDGDTGPAFVELYRKGAFRLSDAGLTSLPRSLELTTAAEKKLAFHLGKFNATALAAARKYEPALVSTYLAGLQPLLSAFYAESDRAATPTQAALTANATRVLGQALHLLGIEISEFHADLPARAQAFQPRERRIERELPAVKKPARKGGSQAVRKRKAG